MYTLLIESMTIEVLRSLLLPPIYVEYIKEAPVLFNFVTKTSKFPPKVD